MNTNIVVDSHGDGSGTVSIERDDGKVLRGTWMEGEEGIAIDGDEREPNAAALLLSALEIWYNHSAEAEGVGFENGFSLQMDWSQIDENAVK